MSPMTEIVRVVTRRSWRALFHENRLHVLIRSEGSRSEPIQRSGPPCSRPPIQVEMATWSNAGRLDWWAKERQQDGVGYAVHAGVNGGSELLIFVLQVAHSHNCRYHSSLVVLAPVGHQFAAAVQMAALCRAEGRRECPRQYSGKKETASTCGRRHK
jgi:hypothetical protein